AARQLDACRTRRSGLVLSGHGQPQRASAFDQWRGVVLCHLESDRGIVCRIDVIGLEEGGQQLAIRGAGEVEGDSVVARLKQYTSATRGSPVGNPQVAQHRALA